MKTIRLLATAATSLITASRVRRTDDPLCFRKRRETHRDLFDGRSHRRTHAHGSLDLPGAPGSLAIDPKRTHLYAAVRSGKQFVTLTIDPATGALSDPVFSPAGIDAAYVQVDETGEWLLGASYSEGVVTVNRITDGVVTGAPVKTLETGKKAHCIQVDPGNRFVFVPHAGELNKVEQFRFDATAGTLSTNTPASMAGDEGRARGTCNFIPMAAGSIS